MQCWKRRLPYRVLAGLVLCVVAAFHVGAARAEASDHADDVVSTEAKLAAAGVQLPTGFTITPVASEPSLANPVAFCFDPQGRIFVAETHRVFHGVEDNRRQMDWLDDDLAARTVEDRRNYIIRRAGDQISHYTQQSELVRLLEDCDGDGLYEQSSVFSTGYDAIESGAAAGVLWIDDRLLFTCIPSLWELRDADGDGQAEHKRELASGFGVHFALFGHDLHGLTHGPDGKIYFSIGDRGLHVKTDDGRLLSNPDSGSVLRCNPDGSGLEIFATGLRNPQELAFNEFGDLFTVDNNSDSGDRARLVHIVEGMDAGWRMSYQYLPDRGPFNREKIWHTQNDEQPASIIPPLAHITDGPSGLVRYPGTGLPPEHAGAFFICDFRPGTSGVRQFWMEPSGATYRLARESMFAGGVLATDCDFGPDGALYVSDWIDGWTGTGKGRIHRITSGDEKSEKQRAATQKLLARIDSLGHEALLAALGHADMRVRLAAQRRLVRIGPSVATELASVAASNTAPLLARIHAIWGIGQLSDKNPQVLAKLAELASDSESEVRVQVARTLAGAILDSDQRRRQRYDRELTALLSDDSPRVRSAAAISLGKLGSAGAAALTALLNVARDNGDREATLRHAAATGLAGTQTADTLLAAAESAGEHERLAIVVALGRQKSPRVAELLDDPSPRVRTEAARVIWDSPIPDAYEPLADALDSAPSENEPMLRRSLAANVALRTPAHLTAVVRCGLRDDLSPEVREHLWQLVRDWAKPSPRDPVHGLWRPLEPRAAEEAVAVLRDALPSMIEAGVHGAPGVVVAAELGVQDAYPSLAGVVVDDRHAAALRARAVAALAKAQEPLALAGLDAAMRSDEPAVRSAALQLMQRRFPDRAVAEAIKVAESGATMERQAAIVTLAKLDAPAAREAIRQWVERLERGQCPPEIQLEVIEAASQSGDTALVEQIKAYQAELSAGGDALTQFVASLKGGNAEVGGRIFQENAALSCRRCHSLRPGEKLVGPSLSDVGLRLSRQELLASIVKPNDKITEGFQTAVLQLATGKVVSGVVRSEDDKRVVLVDADGTQIIVDAAEIDDRFEGLSAMPEELMKLMTPRDLRDLVEFLSQQRVTADGVQAAVPSQKEGHDAGQ
jgi:quinoprotein glucose dehydrogenase